MSGIRSGSHIFPMFFVSPCAGQQDQKLMQEMVESAGKKVSSGMVRRKKEKAQVLKPKGFGFAAVPASSASTKS